MNGNNDNNSGLAAGVGFAFAGAILLGAILFAAAAFFAAIMSIFCLFAWHRPIQLFGHTLTPEEARGFIIRGLGGAMAAPGFVLFVSGFYHVAIRPDAWVYIIVGGYVVGSVVIGFFMGKAELDAAQKAQEAASMQALLPPEQPATPVRTIDLRPSTPAPDHLAEAAASFRFATWDDEEELRK